MGKDSGEHYVANIITADRAVIQHSDAKVPFGCLVLKMEEL